MKPNLPFLLNVEILALRQETVQDWIKRNGPLMDDLIFQAASVLLDKPELDTITILELHSEKTTFPFVKLEREDLVFALETNINNWVNRERYERAALSRDLLARINK